ncbi:MAG TPA: riboflavin synthase [candidate division Zixibacteria bacterium]|nr:riboflavin synthase [candidate division Zixibacteria bacterium]
MFTGLIETTGKILQLRQRGNYTILRMPVQFDGEPLSPGESIACDGVCLTVVAFNENWFEVEASQETAACSILKDYKVGSKINLERALRVGDRLGGHFVTGHVDTVGQVDFTRKVGESLELAVTYDNNYDSFVVPKGSIAINGLSLTVNTCKPGWLAVNLIPHTVRETTVGSLNKGHRVNLEFDMIGKYVARFVKGADDKGLTIEKLKESGW